MVVILKQDVPKSQVDELLKWFEDYGLKTNVVVGDHTTIVGLIGDTSVVNIDNVAANEIVESVKRVQEPYKNVNRKFHPDDSTIEVCGEQIGHGNFKVMAGPCSVESEEQIIEVANRVKAAGAKFLRGGAFKPRTSPYAFQGLRGDGIELLLEAKKATGLPIVTEIMSLQHLDLFADVDIIQVGARNMQNFELLKALGHSDKTILLKRGLANTIEEFLMSAEYIYAGGNSNIILCERGIRTFETMTRNTLDLSAVALIKHLSHLPIIVDPSHATGMVPLVEPMALAAVACGADGLMIEVHNNPSKALSDGAQSMTPDAFDETMGKIKQLAVFCGKTL
ncbi:MAG: 3-deoxy-7-phosphoheptulonate synthase [Oscillospiraceae bacterium]|jgi:3-deoxy-7-phosphoheptulonate synthase